MGLTMPRLLPILHAGGFGWDEAIILVVAILAVPVLSWFTGRLGKRQDLPPKRVRSRRSGPPMPPNDDLPPVE